VARELASHLRLKPEDDLRRIETQHGGEGTGFSSEIETGMPELEAAATKAWRGNWLLI